MIKNYFKIPRLYCPGPTPVPVESSIAALHTNVYHRTDAFREVILECRDLLRPFFGSKEPPIILSSSGTGALEAAIVNLTNPGDEVLVINGGKFGERWEKLAEAFQCKVNSFKINWGTVPDLQNLETELARIKNCRAVFLQANETSTGVAYPVDEIAGIIKKISPQSLIIVDAVSGLVAHKMDMECWGIDCVVSGSQKGFGVPPGLSFIALSDRAWGELSLRSKFYFDLSKERTGQSKGETAWTPATTLIQSLVSSLRTLNHIGPDACAWHHQALSLACRRAVESIGLTLFSVSHHSHALTAVNLPSTIDGLKLVKVCREEFGAIFAGGQDQLKGKIIRISHLGFVDHLALVSGIACLEMALHLLGYRHTLGAATGAAMTSLLENKPL